MSTLQLLIILAGLTHLTVLAASAAAPRVLNWRDELALLQPLSRQLVWVHGVFIVLVIVGFAAVSLLNSAALTDGSMLSRSVCALIAVFWLLRLMMGLFVFDTRSVLTTAARKLGYALLNVVIVFHVAVYGYAALVAGKGGA